MPPISWPDSRPEFFQGHNKEPAYEPYFKERDKSFTETSITEERVPPPDALAVDFKHDLHRGLKSRQIAMARSRVRNIADML